MIHGVELGPEDTNVNVINMTSNIPLLYEDKIDGYVYLKNKERSFIEWPKSYLEKSST